MSVQDTTWHILPRYFVLELKRLWLLRYLDRHSLISKFVRVPKITPRLYTKDGMYRLAKYSGTVIAMASSVSLDGAMESQIETASWI